MDPNKQKALDLALGQITKSYGKGTVMKLGDAAKQRLNVETVSTGSLALDLALGGGVPRGRIVEIFGPEASGKTTLALHIIAEAQKAGGVAAFVDVEHALDPEYSKRIGVDVQDLLISQPDMAEEALEITETLIRSGAVDVIVIDSVAALVPRAEIEGDMGDSHMGLQARLMSQALRKLTGIISRSNTILVFINQIRMKIGVMFGNPETTPGGVALKFFSSVRLDIRRKEQIKDGEKIIGNRVKVKVVKNKVAPPFRVAEFELMYNEGISKVGELVDIGVDLNIITKSGSHYSYGSTKLGQGKQNVKEYLKENQALAREIEQKVIQSASAQLATATSIASDDSKKDDASSDDKQPVEAKEEDKK